jgi:hypothetical protein
MRFSQLQSFTHPPRGRGHVAGGVDTPFMLTRDNLMLTRSID